MIHLDYEAYPEMALPSLFRISSYAKKKWSLFGVAVAHRLGRVPIGEESILIAVSAGHRREAWDAAEWILEEVKRKTEIWKRESYDDPSQEPEWKANNPGMFVWFVISMCSSPPNCGVWTFWQWEIDAS